MWLGIDQVKTPTESTALEEIEGDQTTGASPSLRRDKVTSYEVFVPNIIEPRFLLRAFFHDIRTTWMKSTA
jgi:hypothetical protein